MRSARAASSDGRHGPSHPREHLCRGAGTCSVFSTEQHGEGTGSPDDTTGSDDVESSATTIMCRTRRYAALPRNDPMRVVVPNPRTDLSVGPYRVPASGPTPHSRAGRLPPRRWVRQPKRTTFPVCVREVHGFESRHRHVGRIGDSAGPPGYPGVAVRRGLHDTGFGRLRRHPAMNA